MKTVTSALTVVILLTSATHTAAYCGSLGGLAIAAATGIGGLGGGVVGTKVGIAALGTAITGTRADSHGCRTDRRTRRYRRSARRPRHVGNPVRGGLGGMAYRNRGRIWRRHQDRLAVGRGRDPFRAPQTLRRSRRECHIPMDAKRRAEADGAVDTANGSTVDEGRRVDPPTGHAVRRRRQLAAVPGRPGHIASSDAAPIGARQRRPMGLPGTRGYTAQTRDA